ncbi:hypothetical protein FACS189425_01990 [Clostridia bacterium]|nr:hypothetical protein FACS189425_01990 [Clostridia bacterium]
MDNRNYQATLRKIFDNVMLRFSQEHVSHCAFGFFFGEFDAQNLAEVAVSSGEIYNIERFLMKPENAGKLADFLPRFVDVICSGNKWDEKKRLIFANEIAQNDEYAKRIIGACGHSVVRQICEYCNPSILEESDNIVAKRVLREREILADMSKAHESRNFPGEEQEIQRLLEVVWNRKATYSQLKEALISLGARNHVSMRAVAEAFGRDENTGAGLLNTDKNIRLFLDEAIPVRIKEVLKNIEVNIPRNQTLATHGEKFELYKQAAILGHKTIAEALVHENGTTLARELQSMLIDIFNVSNDQDVQNIVFNGISKQRFDELDKQKIMALMENGYSRVVRDYIHIFANENRPQPEQSVYTPEAGTIRPSIRR